MRISARAQACFLACFLAAVWPVRAGAWCDVVFKDVAREAEVVLLARIEKVKGETPAVHVVEVLKGRYGESALTLASSDLDLERVRHDDHVLVALDSDSRPLRAVRSLGFCQAISVLPVRGGKLRARDRADYDSGGEAISLEEIRADLSRDLADDSASARLSDR